MIIKRDVDNRQDPHAHIVLTGGTTVFFKDWDSG